MAAAEEAPVIERPILWVLTFRRADFFYPDRSKKPNGADGKAEDQR